MIDYAAAAETYDNTRTHSDEVIDRFHATVPLDAATAVLDFGCGTGNYLFRIHQRFACRCQGIEPSDGMRRRAMEKPGMPPIAQGDHLAIPFAAEAFDFCYMTDVIHHIPDLSAMFRELMRVLRSDGHMCIVTESHAQIDGRFYNRYFPSLAAKEKRRYPDIGEIVACAEDAGFITASIETVAAPPRHVTDGFLQNVREKNWSMFRLLTDEEFAHGLARLNDDAGCVFESSASGETFVWFRKTPASSLCPGKLPSAK